MCNESPDRWRVRQRARPESAAPDSREGTTQFVRESNAPFLEFVPGDEAAVPKRWASGDDVFAPTPFARLREVRHSQNHLRSDPSSIDSQLLRRPRWSEITARAGLSTRNRSIATCNESGHVSDRGDPAKTRSVRV